MSNIAGTFFVGMIIDGDKVDGNLRATAPLSQFFKKDTDTCIPDWKVASNQPVIYPVMRSQNEGLIKGVVEGTEKWWYNGVEITFNASGVATAPAVIAQKLKKVTHNNGTINVPSLRIVGNLASASNMDSDIIRMTGNVEASGHQLPFDVFILLEIAEYSDSEYMGFLNATNGGIIDEEGEKITVTKSLYKGGSIMNGGYTVEWLKPPYTTVFSSAESVSLGRNDIDSRLNLMCRFKVNNSVVDTRIIPLSDEIDPYFVACEFSGTNMLESTGVNSSVNVTYKTKKQGTGDVIPGYTFNTVLTGAKGQPVTLDTAPTPTGCTISYNDVKKASGSISGFVTGIKK